nr:unnamed protein product [Spirometra erinaceieuropaei]
MSNGVTHGCKRRKESHQSLSLPLIISSSPRPTTSNSHPIVRRDSNSLQARYPVADYTDGACETSPVAATDRWDAEPIPGVDQLLKTFDFDAVEDAGLPAPHLPPLSLYTSLSEFDPHSRLPGEQK